MGLLTPTYLWPVTTLACMGYFHFPPVMDNVVMTHKVSMWKLFGSLEHMSGVALLGRVWPCGRWVQDPPAVRVPFLHLLFFAVDWLWWAERSGPSPRRPHVLACRLCCGTAGLVWTLICNSSMLVSFSHQLDTSYLGPFRLSRNLLQMACREASGGHFPD